MLSARTNVLREHIEQDIPAERKAQTAAHTGRRFCMKKDCEAFISLSLILVQLHNVR
jgi:hypothetical protein